MTDRTYPQTLARVALAERLEIATDAAALHAQGLIRGLWKSIARKNTTEN